MNTTGDAGRIVDGYRLNGARGSEVSGPDMSFTAPFGVAAIVGSDQRVDSTWQAITQEPIGVYFGDTIKMISMIVISGNWWVP
jgi:hypothetical protein